MIEFWIANLVIEDQDFGVPSTSGTWEFRRRTDYEDLIDRIQEDQCANTFYAFNESITPKSSDSDFESVIDDLINTCLVLSFIYGKCITPTGTTAQSEISFIQMGDKFIRARAISGFPALDLSTDLSAVFSSGMASMRPSFSSRRMQLFLSHWISGLTCFTLEDLFLSIGVQMDIVKQCEILATDNHLTYFKGMERASQQYSISQLSADYKKMRDDIVHEGRLSGSNFRNKTKRDCSVVISDTLNWIDKYIASVLSINNHISSNNRWKALEIEHGLPSLSFHV